MLNFSNEDSDNLKILYQMNIKCLMTNVKKTWIPRLVTEEYQGLNYTLQNKVYLHDNGHSYQKYKLNKDEITVFLRCQFGKFKNRVLCNGTAKLDKKNLEICAHCVNLQLI